VIVVPQYIVAIAFSMAALVIFADMLMVRATLRKMGRFCQGIIVTAAAYFYWVAEAHQTLPSQDLRIVWIALAISIGSEVISRWEWIEFSWWRSVGGKTK
jgi:uncharacterized membrane protein